MAAADKTIAGIAAPLAAELAGAVVYEEAIEDNVSSQTRFCSSSSTKRCKSWITLAPLGSRIGSP